MSATTSVPRTARERARREITDEITRVAREHLAVGGAAALSLRAVAREVGMVSSAVYRYFPSRDDLLTALIIDAYTAVGAAAQAAERSVPRADRMGRWLAVANAVRAWAKAAPHEYSLIFGTPVPGYRAPQDTIDPAATVPVLLLELLADAGAAGRSVAWAGRPIAAEVRRDLADLRASLSGVVPSPIDDAAAMQGIMAWTQLIGVISFELFGHLHNVIVDHDRYFVQQMRNIGLDLGFGSRPARR